MHLEGYRSRELHAGVSSAPPLPTFVVNWKSLDAAMPAAQAPPVALYVCDAAVSLQFVVMASIRLRYMQRRSPQILSSNSERAAPPPFPNPAPPPRSS